MSHFKRSEVVGITRRAPDYYDAVPATPQIATAHAPEFTAGQREIFANVEPSEGITDPMGRAKSRLANAEQMTAELLFMDGLREAQELELEVRAGRPPPPEPLLSESERMSRAAAALTTNRSTE